MPPRPRPPATWEVALPVAAPSPDCRPPRGRLRWAEGRRLEPRPLRGRRGEALRGLRTRPRRAYANIRGCAGEAGHLLGGARRGHERPG